MTTSIGTIVHACCDAMVTSKIITIARKRQVFGLCEENVLQVYLNGYRTDVYNFFTKNDVYILKENATTDRDKKLFRLAAISPILLAMYRTDNLPGIVRRLINRFL